MDYLDPAVLGPLFRFNREFYELDERGRPAGYRNLARLHERIRPFLLRRRKADVETELPERTDRTFFVTLPPQQQTSYDGYKEQVARLAALAKRRPLTRQEQEKMLRLLGMMRMTCDTNYILDREDRTCAKLAELERILEECRENAGVKVIVFSEWERMLELVRELACRLDLGYAWHTGSVPQRRRRAEINCFKSDPQCRLFLSTDSGAAGLNLQAASVVINCDLPWNPAKLEQRIARAWRKNQTRPVTVINLVAENTIEHRMLETLAHKQALSDGVLDRRGDLDAIKIRSGRQAFFEKLQQLILPRAPRPAGSAPAVAPKPPLPADRALGFARAARERINGSLVRCEERYPLAGAHSVLFVVVDREAAQWRERLAELHAEYFRNIDPLAPVQLEVVDRATDDALRRLAEAGLIAGTMRGARPLFPEVETGPGPAELAPEQRARAEASRARAKRQLQLARVLGEGGFSDEARAPLLEAALALGGALAIEHRLPEPGSLDDAQRPPLSSLWGETLPALRAFAADPAQPWKPLADGLAGV